MNFFIFSLNATTAQQTPTPQQLQEQISQIQHHLLSMQKPAQDPLSIVKKRYNLACCSTVICPACTAYVLPTVFFLGGMFTGGINNFLGTTLCNISMFLMDPFLFISSYYCGLTQNAFRNRDTRIHEPFKSVNFETCSKLGYITYDPLRIELQTERHPPSPFFLFCLRPLEPDISDKAYIPLSVFCTCCACHTAYLLYLKNKISHAKAAAQVQKMQ